MDTIYALATARGKSGVAVIRLSGDNAHAAVSALCGKLPPARSAALRKLSWAGEVLDEAIVVLFEKGASFTGEQSAELQIHGSLAVQAAVLRALSEIAGLRLAEAGEFTRRALENGCLDLTQVEGLADLIDAETESQRRQAQRVLSGAMGRKVEVWRRLALRAAALLEATIDFADEDVPVDVVPEVSMLIASLLEQLRSELAGAKAAERLREGFEVAIVGAPNVGKSTLLNALAGRDAAITSETAGTTRDVIEVRMDLSGLSVTLLDTAGLRQTTDKLEMIGIERAIARAKTADLRVFLVTEGDERSVLEPTGDDLVVFGKADIAAPGARDGVFAVSGLTGWGIDGLIAEITKRLSLQVASAGLVIRERQRLAIASTIAALERVEVCLDSEMMMPELVSAELRQANRFLESLIGRIDVESLLGEIFSSFCIGK